MKSVKAGNEDAYRAPLLAWYAQERRTLPWREDPLPYRVWVSEIMLQQTRVDTVIPYFERFLEAFPTIEALADAPLDDVLARWSGLGYYSRARNLHKGAQAVRDEHGGEIPASLEGLVGLPGVGRYTAGAIASIAFGIPAPIVDGNVIRVFSRWFDLSDDISQAATKKRLWAWAEQLVPQEVPGDFNQAMMELGALVCTPKDPGCGACPMESQCVSLEAGTVLKRPVKPARKKPKETPVRAVVIEDMDGDYLLVQRPTKGLFGGLWEVPLGEGLGEASRPKIQQWVQQRLGIETSVASSPGRVRHVLSHKKMDIAVYSCRVEGRRPSVNPQDYQGYRWVSGDHELEGLGVGTITRKVLAATPPQLALEV